MRWINLYLSCMVEIAQLAHYSNNINWQKEENNKYTSILMIIMKVKMMWWHKYLSVLTLNYNPMHHIIVMCVKYVCFVHMILVCALWLISLLVNPSSAGRRLEFVVAMVVLLGDLRRGTDHQNTPLQRSRASAGRQRLRGKWERDSGLPCRSMSKWVELTQTQQHHLRYSCVTDRHPNFLMPPQGCIFCVLGRPSASLSGNVDSNQHNMLPLAPLGSTFLSGSFSLQVFT